MAYTQDNLDFTVTTPLGKDKLLFKSLQGDESISGLFDFKVELLSEAKELDFKKIVGKNITVTMQFANKNKRFFNGIVMRFVQAGGDARFTIYYADVRPWLWVLSLTQNCKIFQNLSVPEIIKKVFDDLGFKGAEYYRDALTQSYDKREYCVQYEESAFNFVSRLMEEEGIYYFFEHEESKHVLVLADDCDAHKDCPGINTARFWQVPHQLPPEDAINECQLSQQVTIGKYAVDDFNFEIPATDLLKQVTGQSGKMRRYEYPAGYAKTAQGEKIAKRRIESYEWEDDLLEGQGYCFSLVAGHKFKLTEHPAKNFNAEYVLRWVSHSLSLSHYSNSFQAFPAKIPFRAPIVTPKPKIYSTQTAIVVGKKGEEIFTDKYGRIKVQFHWDQDGKNDEKSSCWIRVNQGWAGKNWGSLWLPRIGQEVIVSFLNGNPDTPLVTGAVYNAQQTVPYTLPTDQTKSTIKSNTSKGGKGYNEIRFEDKKDKEEFWVHAQKDMNIVVEHDRTKKVLNDETNTIKMNRTTTIEEKDDKLTVAKGNRTTTIKLARTTSIQEKDDTLTVGKGSRIITIQQKDYKLTVAKGNREVKVQKGNETHLVQGTREIKIIKDETHINQANFTQKVTKNYLLKVTGNLTIDVTGNITLKSAKSITLKAGMNITSQAGMNLTAKAGMNLTNKATMSLTNDAGMSLTNKAGMALTNKAGLSLTDKAVMITNDASAMLTSKAGAMHQAKAGALMMVKGAIVMIN
ncbi:MAG: type VI secretion system tip protein TssI/VgrG [Candidatus Parabeggiatoa sp.]|nr:type VI secretion system tip protein TssI/VgrG [Candidatus Parabeggiatoa sp.]